MTGTSNGQPAPPQVPPWWGVDPKVAMTDLANQLASCQAEMALMRAYIAQLHDALQVAGVVPQEQQPSGVG